LGALGFVSLLMDDSSEIIHALLPIYLVTMLGTSMLTVGLIEGIAEATASTTKVFLCALSCAHSRVLQPQPGLCGRKTKVAKIGVFRLTSLELVGALP